MESSKFSNPSKQAQNIFQVKHPGLTKRKRLYQLHYAELEAEFYKRGDPVLEWQLWRPCARRLFSKTQTFFFFQIILFPVTIILNDTFHLFLIKSIWPSDFTKKYMENEHLRCSLFTVINFFMWIVLLNLASQVSRSKSVPFAPSQTLRDILLLLLC